MKKPTFLPLILLILTPLLLADMGPKPSADFEIIYEEESPPELTGYSLFLCETEDCSSSPPLMEEFSNLFECDQNSCTSWGYDYSEFMYITFNFADGTTLTSNLFTKKHFNAQYDILVGPDNLEVNETGGSNFGRLGGPVGWVIFSSIAGAVCGGISIIITIILVIGSFIRKRRKKQSEAEIPV